MQSVSYKSRILNFLRIVTGKLDRMESEVGGAAILVYHAVTCETLYPELERYCTPVKVFRRHMTYLKRSATVITLQRLLEALQTCTPIDPRWVVITMDDALKSQTTWAAEVLDEYGFPWVLAVPTGLIESGRSVWTYELSFLVLNWIEPVLPHPNGKEIPWKGLSVQKRENWANDIKLYLIHHLGVKGRTAYVNRLIDIFGKDRFFEMFQSYGLFELATWSQLRSLDRSGVELLVHGATHQPLNHTITEKGLVEELCMPKQHFQKYLKHEPEGFALPGGIMEDRVLELVKKYGYRYCMTSNTKRVHSGTNCFELPRIDAEYPLSVLRQHMLRAI